MPRQVLILFAHPALEKSRANRRLLRAVEGLEGVTLRDHYEDYPDFLIDVPREQEDLKRHDVILFQHPFFWYSSPALIKEWLDLVLTYGFAYGPDATELLGKTVLSVITAGGPAAAYTPEGYNHFSVRQLLAPFEQTARLCGMKYLDPFVIHDANELSEAALDEAALAYRELLVALRDAPNLTELKTSR
jgi:glutathione-regulated potassium-efflux system ancillary protein KefG